MNAPKTILLIIDNDPKTLHGLQHLLATAGYQVRVLSSKTVSAPVLQADSPRCAIIDLHLDGQSGLQAWSDLERALPDIPVIFLSGEGDVVSTVEAMKSGAIDCLVKPLDERAVLESVRRAFDSDTRLQTVRHELTELSRRFNSLTPREHQVLELVVEGKLNKQIGAELGTCEKTVKVHRGRIMRKMAVQSLAELVQYVVKLRSASGVLNNFAPSQRVNAPFHRNICNQGHKANA
jgi:FixJ family two-component response regulator